jgi:nucleoside-triphosphatase THEP1
MEKVIINELNEKWLKASVLGTIWASSEIVLGSFLHNLKIPFSGSILTVIALIILISVSYQWKEKGIIWRAGLICALMKTMSPSAVIFGPMVAILAEAFILETSIRIFGRTVFGYVLGSIIAMSWILVQKILNFIIYYGYNIVELYESLMNYVQKQLYWNFDAVWMPVIFLLSVYAFFGILAAIIGMSTGYKLVNENIENNITSARRNGHPKKNKNLHKFNYSLSWLVLDICFIILPLVLISYIPFLYWFLIIFFVVVLWALRYKRALRQLVRPKFWIFFVLITMATAFVFTSLNAENTSVIDGLRIGVEMNLRAIILIMGFTVLGTELYNPRIRSFFMNSYFKQLPIALELATDTLPSMIGAVPAFKSIVRNPVGVIYHIVSHAEFKLQEIKKSNILKTRTYIISGGVGEGKTSQVVRIVEHLEKRKIKTGGIYSLRIMENDLTTGYDLVDVSSSERWPFLRLKTKQSAETIGKYEIVPEGLQNGLSAIDAAIQNNAEIMIIDEVGRLELGDRGWSKALDQLFEDNRGIIIMSVRSEFIQAVVEKWRIRSYFLVGLNDEDFKDFCEVYENNHSLFKKSGIVL